MSKAVAILLTEDNRKTLTRWSRNRVLPKRQRSAAQVLLLAAQGVASDDIARRMRGGRNTVWRCRKRFRDSGLKGVGRKASRGKRDAVLVAIVGRLAFERPPGKRWITRTLTQAAKCSPSTVWRCCQDYDVPLSSSFIGRLKKAALIIDTVAG